MHGGTITKGRLATSAVLGAYWMSWTSSFSNTTLPGLHRRVAPDLEGALVGRADAPALGVGEELAQPARKTLAARLERLLERLRVGGGEIGRAHGVDPLLHRKARTLLRQRLKRGLLHRFSEIARSEEVRLLEVVVVGIGAPLRMSEAPVTRLRRDDLLAAAIDQSAPKLRLFLEVARLKSGICAEPRSVDWGRGRCHQPHPALRQFVGGLRDRREDGLWEPRFHARAHFAPHKRRRQMILTY